MISPRRNKWGKIFDFGRFRKEGDLRMLVVKLDAIMIDGVRIHTNILIFVRKKDEFKMWGSQGGLMYLKYDFPKFLNLIRNTKL